jgi:hypothetical protein
MPMPTLTVFIAGAINCAWISTRCYRRGRLDGQPRK